METRASRIDLWTNEQCQYWWRWQSKFKNNKINDYFVSTPLSRNCSSHFSIMACKTVLAFLSLAAEPQATKSRVLSSVSQNELFPQVLLCWGIPWLAGFLAWVLVEEITSGGGDSSLYGEAAAGCSIPFGSEPISSSSMSIFFIEIWW